MANENIDTQFNFQGFTTLKKDLREAVQLYQQMLQSGTATTEQIEAQAKVVARLKDEIDDANDATAALTGAGRIQAMGRAVTAVAGGFTALQGVIALAGNESEDLQKTMVKLQAALSISAGLSQLEDLGNAMKNAARATGLTTIAMQAYTFVTNGATLATKALRAALVTTGAGAILVGLGLIAAKLLEIFDASKKSNEEIKKLPEIVEEARKGIESSVNATLGVIEDETNFLIDQIKKAQAEGKKTIELVFLDGTKRNLRLTQEEINKFYAERKAKAVTEINTLIQLQSQEVSAAKKTESEKQQLARETTRTFQVELLKRSQGQGNLTDEEFKNLERLKNTRKTEALLATTARKNEEANLDALNLKRRKILIDQLTTAGDIQKTLSKTAEEGINEEIKRYEAGKKAELAILQESNELVIREMKANQEDEEEIAIKSLEFAQELAKQERKAEEELLKETIRLRKKAGLDVTKIEQQLEFLKATNRDIDAVEEKEMANLKVALAKQTADKIIAEEERVRAERQKDLDFAEEAINRATRREILATQRSKKSTVEKERDIQQAEENRFTALRNLYKMYGKDALEIEELITAKVEEQAKKRTDAIAAGYQAVLQLGSTLTQGLIDLDNIRTQNIINNENLTEAERERVAKESFERQKKLQIAMATIDFAKAVASIYAQWPKFDGGFMMYAAIAQALLTAGVTIAKIKAVEYQSPISGSSTDNQGPAGSKFASGGLLMGKSHDQGGIKTAIGELEGGEFLINKIAAERFMPILEKINSFGQQPTERMAKSETPIFKTYVVASEMSSELQKRKKMKKLAQL